MSSWLSGMRMTGVATAPSIPVGVEVLDGFEDLGVEGVRVDARGVAVIDAVPVAGLAGVVTLGAAAAVTRWCRCSSGCTPGR